MDTSKAGLETKNIYIVQYTILSLSSAIKKLYSTAFLNVIGIMTIRSYETDYCRWQQFIVVFCFVASATALNCTGDPCMYGICIDNNNSSYSCYCIDGYTGINCEINYDDCWSAPCLNGGICNDAVASYNCTCPDGFIGTNCELKYSECMNQPCLNNGTCIDYNGFTCQCPEGYSGDYCEIDISVCNSTICRNGGECIDGPGYSFVCHCREGWTGELCDEDVDECVSSPCQNGGLCLNIPATYTCACLFGFTGKDCDKIIVACDENPCHNDAMCLEEDSQPTCYCVPDYHGQFCEMRYDDCESKFAKCENGGTCIDGINNYTCSCPPSYSGPMCTDYIPLPTVEVTSYRPAATTLDLNLPSTSTPSSTVQFTTFHENPPTVAESNYTREFTVKPTLTTYDTTNNVTPGDKLNETTERSSTNFYKPTTLQLGTTKDSLSTERTTTVIETSKSVFQTSETTTMKPGTQFFTSTPTSQVTLTTKMTVNLSFTEQDVTKGPVSTTPVNWMTTQQIETTKDSRSLGTTLSDDRSTKFFTTMPTTLKSYDGTQILLSTSSTTDGLLSGIATTLGDSVTTREPLDSTLTTVKYSVNCTSNSTDCECTAKGTCKPSPTVINAAFNGKSYVRQQVNIDGNGLLKVYLKLKTKSKNGIILHAFFDEERYVLLYMELGQLKFQFSCGLQTMLLGEIDTPINNGKDVDIEMRFRYLVENQVGKCSAQLFVNDTMAMSGEQMLSAREDIPQGVRLHLGGIPQAFTHYFPRIAMGFIGCMSLLKVNDVEKHFILDSTETFQIEECTSFLCLLNPCRNFGSCHDIDGKVYCKCIAGYTGEMCERSACDDNPCYLGATCISSPGTGFICVCPLGMHGLRCEEESIIVQPSFSVFIPGFSSYIAYGINAAIKDSMELKMRILPHTTDQISLIAFMGQSGSARDLSDHFSVTYVKGYIMLTWDLGSGVRRIFTKNPLPDRPHRPHTISVGRRGRDAWLSVNGLDSVKAEAAGTMTQLDVSPVLYIGGHKSKNFETLPHDLPLHTGFTGCIFEVELRTGSSVTPVTRSSPATGRGVGECHRNECTHNSCKNGAVCLNHGPTYSCICMKEWEGPECSIPAIACSSNPSCHKTDR